MSKSQASREVPPEKFDFTHSLEDISFSKFNFGKGQNARNINLIKGLFPFLSYSAGVIGNLHHTLTPCPLSSYSLDCVPPKMSVLA